MKNQSEKSKLSVFLLCTFLGTYGVHRFYVGKVGTGLLYLFTLGLFGFGTLFDWISILVDRFKDKEGNTIDKW